MKSIILVALLSFFCWQSTGYTLPFSRNIRTAMTGCGSPGAPCWSCSGEFDLIKKKANTSVIQKAPNTLPDSCLRLRGWSSGTLNTKEQYKMRYDSLRRYVESCAVSDNDWSSHAFLYLDNAVQQYDPDDTTRYDRYREWMISVLYLNTTNPYYYCNCLGSIAGTYQYGKYYSTNAGLAVFKYLRTIKPCDDKGLEEEITKDSLALLKRRLDTTIPSLEDLGLGFLLTHNSVSPSTALPTIFLASFTSSPNPFKTETTLSFELNRMAYVTVEVFDPLGRKVWGDDHGYSLDKGIHTVHLDGSKFSSGAYYARISTGFGEVKTLKLVKQ